MHGAHEAPIEVDSASSDAALVRRLPRAAATDEHARFYEAAIATQRPSEDDDLMQASMNSRPWTPSSIPGTEDAPGLRASPLMAAAAFLYSTPFSIAVVDAQIAATGHCRNVADDLRDGNGGMDFPEGRNLRREPQCTDRRGRPDRHVNRFLAITDLRDGLRDRLEATPARKKQKSAFFRELNPATAAQNRLHPRSVSSALIWWLTAAGVTFIS